MLDVHRHPNTWRVPEGARLQLARGILERLLRPLFERQAQMDGRILAVLDYLVEENAGLKSRVDELEREMSASAEGRDA